MNDEYEIHNWVSNNFRFYIFTYDNLKAESDLILFDGMI